MLKLTFTNQSAEQNGSEHVYNFAACLQFVHLFILYLRFNF